MSKKIILFLIALNLCIIFSLQADETYWDAQLVRGYVHNSDLQRRWAMAFLANHLRQLNGDENILDIGSGDGKITADVSRFIPKGTITGIDPSKGMLDWANKQYSPIEYPNLSFGEGGFLESNLTGQFDLILSTCAFQHCSNQPQGLSNLHALLKPQGKLLILIPSMDNMPWKLARKAIQTSEKWAAYWQNMPPRKFPSPDEFAVLLKNAHFKALRIEKIQTSDPFYDREELLSFLLGTFQPAVPAEQARNYYNEIIDEYLRLSPGSIKDGVIDVRFGRIEVEAIKE